MFDAMAANNNNNTVYQIVSTRTVNTQHGQLIILSLQNADGSCCNCLGMWYADERVAAKPMMMVNSRLFVGPTGSKRLKEYTIHINCCSADYL